MCDSDSVAAAERSLPRLLRAPISGMSIECSERAGDGLRYRELGARIASLFREKVYPLLYRLAGSGVEYFYVAGWNGEYAMGPGTEREVTLPLIPSVVFAHTHPGPVCYPSWRDLRSFADYFASGGIGEFIVSTSCLYSIVLREPFTDECYDELVKLSSCVRSSEGRDDAVHEYLACLNRLPSITCLEASIY